MSLYNIVQILLSCFVLLLRQLTFAASITNCYDVIKLVTRTAFIPTIDSAQWEQTKLDGKIGNKVL